MGPKKLFDKSKIAKNIAMIGMIMFIVGMIIHFLLLFLNNDKLLLWAVLLDSFGFAFLIGSGIKYWNYIKKWEDMNKDLEDTRG